MKFTIFQHSVQGGKIYNEDRLKILDSEHKNGFVFGVGVFDGHGGSEASDYCQHNLLPNLDEVFGKADHFADKEYVCGIESSFAKVHLDMFQDHGNWTRKPGGGNSTAGTTATVGLFKGNMMYLGHVGDSAAILCRSSRPEESWEGTNFAPAHTLKDTAERDRVIRNGGKILNKGTELKPYLVVTKQFRVDSRHSKQVTLNMTRALGDFWSLNKRTNRYIISPEPYVRSVDLYNEEVRCLVFCSDGVVDVMTPQDISNFVQSKRESLGDRRKGRFVQVAQELCMEAEKRWNALNIPADNISAIVIYTDMIEIGQTFVQFLNSDKVV